MPTQPSEVVRQAAEWVVQLRSPDRPVIASSHLRTGCASRRYTFVSTCVPSRCGRGWRIQTWVADARGTSSSRRRATPISSSFRRRPITSYFISQRLPVAPGGIRPCFDGVFALAYIGWQQTTVIKVTTGLGEQHSEVLPDHSVVELNTQSEIRVGFTAAERRVELVRGEAFFDVAKDPARPFIVVTDLATAKAVGTRFSVYRALSGTIVTVAEGRVAGPRQTGQSGRTGQFRGADRRC